MNLMSLHWGGSGVNTVTIVEKILRAKIVETTATAKVSPQNLRAVAVNKVSRAKVSNKTVSAKVVDNKVKARLKC